MQRNFCRGEEREVKNTKEMALAIKNNSRERVGNSEKVSYKTIKEIGVVLLAEHNPWFQMLLPVKPKLSRSRIKKATFCHQENRRWNPLSPMTSLQLLSAPPIAEIRARPSLKKNMEPFA